MNSLDGYTILRFSRAFANGAGVEQHLEDLNRTLLERHEMKIIQFYLSEADCIEKPKVINYTKGILEKIPLRVTNLTLRGYADRQNLKKTKNPIIKDFIRDRILYNPILYKTLFKKVIQNKAPSQKGYCAQNAGEEAQKVFEKHDVDLVAMHSVGGQDSASVIRETISRQIPFIVENHFSNDRLNHISIRAQLINASMVAGVSGVGVPKYLKRRFCNLLNGIDTDVFHPKAAKPVGVSFNAPVIFMPARIVATKGQQDLIKAASILKKSGQPIQLVFAGRPDSPKFIEELKKQIADLGMEDSVHFPGQLDKEALRDWYGKASVVCLPTYHHEGLSRILLEAQAMKVPPIAYNVGGLSEGLIHKETGFLVSKGDIRKFAERLKEILIDEQKRNDMGEAGRLFIENKFSLLALARRHEALYLSIVRK